jgi:hypothetical protein
MVRKNQDTAVSREKFMGQGGVVFGVVFTKKYSQIGKKPPKNRLQIFSLILILYLNTVR